VGRGADSAAHACSLGGRDDAVGTRDSRCRTERPPESNPPVKLSPSVNQRARESERVAAASHWGESNRGGLSSDSEIRLQDRERGGRGGHGSEARQG